MQKHPFCLTTRADGSYHLETPDVRLHATVKPPKLEGESCPPLRFDHASQKDLRLGGMHGVIHGDVSETEGLTVRREIFLSEDRCFAAVRMSVRNDRRKTIRLDFMDPVNVSREGDLRIGCGGLGDWRIARMGRQKSDIPGSFSFAERDSNFTDATFDATKLVAGMGVDNDTDEDVFRTDGVIAEPAFYIKNMQREGSPGVFFGVIGQDQHLTMFMMTPDRSGTELDQMRSICEFDCVPVDPGEERQTHWILMTEVAEERNAFSDFTEIFAAEYGIPKPEKAPVTVYCTWQFYSFNFFPEDLDEMLAELNRRPMPIDVIQLDNGWIDIEGDWGVNKDVFPMGMKPIADKIMDAGYIAGIWTCPLVIRSDSKMLAEHPDLAAETAGGGGSEYKYVNGHSYAVDPTSPFFREYIMNLYAKLREWGFKYHKLDFLRSVIVDENIRFHDRKVNRAQAYRIANRVIREAIGDDYFASCGGIHDAGNAGYADALRTSADTYGFWHLGKRAKDAPIRMKENVWRAYTNRLWRTDPDAACLRRRESVFRKQRLARHEILNFGYFNDEEAFTVLVNQYVSGGNVCLCERLAELDEDRRALYRHVIPSAGIPAKILRAHWKTCPNFFLTEVKPKAEGLDRWWTLAVTNWTDEPVMQEIDLELLGLPGEIENVAIFEFYRQCYEGIMSSTDSFTACVPPHGSRLYRIATWTDKEPILLGTDLHMTGGGVEITRISFEQQAVRGTIENPWPCPVRITALFPFEDRQRVMLTYVPPAQDKFLIERE